MIEHPLPDWTSVLRNGRRPLAGSGRRPSRRLQKPVNSKDLHSGVLPVVDIQLDAALGTLRSGVKAEWHQWMHSDTTSAVLQVVCDVLEFVNRLSAKKTVFYRVNFSIIEAHNLRKLHES